MRATYEGEDWNEAREEIAGLMDSFDLPGGYSWSWNDRMIEQGTQGQEMGGNILLALLLVYLVMARCGDVPCDSVNSTGRRAKETK